MTAQSEHDSLLKTCWCGGPVEVMSPEDSTLHIGGYMDAEIKCTDSHYHNPWDTKPTGIVSKLYVSGPMSGIKDCNYPTFAEASRNLRAAGFHVVNPAEVEVGSSYREIIKEDVRQMMACDGVATLDNWWLSTGARVETHLAGVLQMTILPVESWLSSATGEPQQIYCTVCHRNPSAGDTLVCEACS